MEIKFVDPRALKDNPNKARRSKSSPQADALLLATIKAVGIVQPPMVAPKPMAATAMSSRRVTAASNRRSPPVLRRSTLSSCDAAEDGGAMRSLVETIAHEQLNPVDQWRGIERLVALGWTEEAIAVALALSVRHIRKLRLLANVLPAMLDRMAKGDMPNEQQLRTIAAASLDEQRQVWKAHKPKKGDARSPGGASPTASPRPACMRATRASATIWRKPTASSGSRICSRRPTRTAATRPMSRRSSAPSRSG